MRHFRAAQWRTRGEREGASRCRCRYSGQQEGDGSESCKALPKRTRGVGLPESTKSVARCTTNSESEPYPFFCAVCCGEVGSPTFTVRSSTPPAAAARRCWHIPSLPPPSPSHGRASASPTFHARAAAGRGDVPTCCHHDAAICSYDLLLLTAVIDYVLANAQKPSSMICAQFRPCRREHGRRAPHGHLQAGFARRVRRQSRRGEAPRLAAELVCEACRLAGQR